MSLTAALPSPLTSIVVSILDSARIADEAIQAVWPEDEPAGLFALLEPPDSLHGKPLELYRGHATELVLRVSKRGDTTLATGPEILVAMLNQSLRAPLNRDGHLVSETLFARYLPGRLELDARESYPGHLADLLTELQRKLRVPRRRLKASVAT